MRVDKDFNAKKTCPVTSGNPDNEGRVMVETKKYVDYFDEIVEEMKEIHKKKNADYGNNFHKLFEEWGFITALLRLSDKMERLKNIYKKEEIQVKDESVYDTLIDLANYAVMTAVELRNGYKPNDIKNDVSNAKMVLMD